MDIFTSYHQFGKFILAYEEAKKFNKNIPDKGVVAKKMFDIFGKDPLSRVSVDNLRLVIENLRY